MKRSENTQGAFQHEHSLSLLKMPNAEISRPHLNCVKPGFTQEESRVQSLQETRVQSLGQEDALEKGMAPHREIPWTEVFGGLQSMELQRVRQDWATDTFFTSILPLSCLRVHNSPNHWILQTDIPYETIRQFWKVQQWLGAWCLGCLHSVNPGVSLLRKTRVKEYTLLGPVGLLPFKENDCHMDGLSAPSYKPSYKICLSQKTLQRADDRGCK